MKQACKLKSGPALLKWLPRSSLATAIGKELRQDGLQAASQTQRILAQQTDGRPDGVIDRERRNRGRRAGEYEDENDDRILRVL